MTRKKPIIGVVGKSTLESDNDAVIAIWEKTRTAIVQKGENPITCITNTKYIL